MEKENMVINAELKDEEIVADSPKRENKEIKEDRVMDVLEKIREEERAKLEALRESEQEKTRIAIEQERERLEAELAREIRELEKQLDRAKLASEIVKSQPNTDIPAILVDNNLEDKLAITEISSPTEENIKEEEKAKPAAKKTTTRKTTTKKTAAQKEKEEEAKAKKEAEAKAKKETEAKAKKEAEAKAKKEAEAKAKKEAEAKAKKEAEAKAKKEAEEKAKKEAEAKAKKEAEEKAKKEAEAKAKKEAEAKEKKEAEEKGKKEAEAKAKKEAEEKAKKEAEAKAKKEAEAKAKKEAEEKVKKEAEAKAKKEAEEKVKKEAEEKTMKEELVKEEKEVEKKPIDLFGAKSISTRTTAIPKTDIKSKPSTAMTSLQKLREKIAAQKRHERELMEREALRAQEKERTLQEKFVSLQRIIEEEENLVTLDELEQERQNVDRLRREIEELEAHIENLQAIIDKVSELSIDGIKVINPITWELSEEFVNLGIDANVLNSTVIEIEEELDALSKSREEYINKLIKAEENYKVLEELYNQQEQLIADLNNQVANLREQVAKEKVLNREYSTQIDRLKSEKNRLERSIKYFRPSEVVPLDESAEGVQGLLVDLERLNEEVRKLVSNDESKKFKEELVKKDLEIEELKKQLEEIKAKKEKETEQGYPYYANAANLFIPRGYNYAPVMPQPDMLDLYMNEVRKLREEIEKMKQPQMAEPTAKPEVFKEDSIPEVKAEPKVVEDQIEESQPEELDPKQQRILELEKQIQEKDQYIESIKKQMHELSEEDIFDPEFKRKIRVIRDKKAELEKQATEEEKLFQENSNKLTDQINVVRFDINGVKDRIFELDLNYRQNRDFSIATTEEYEKAKSKALVELQLLEEKLNNFTEDLAKVEEKYQRFISNKEAEMNKLNEEEVNTIQYYLNKMIKDNQISSKLETTEAEKEDLVKELDQLKRKENDDVVTEINAYEEEEKRLSLENKINQLESEIEKQTRKYNIYYDKINELKAELSKRLEIETNLRENDDDIATYASSKHALDDFQDQYVEINERIQILQLEIDNVNSTPKEEVLRKKAEITDLLVRREDLKAKIEFYKAKLVELENDENVSMYKRLVNQISQIRKISKEHRTAAESLKADVNNKTRELEVLKSELKML